jgi:2-methylisocitrate lyase-like PEP mutase family enzyme
MVNGGVTPVMKPEALAELGYRIAIFPSAGFLAACKALNAVYGSLKQNGDAEDGGVDLFSFGEFNALMGFKEIIEFEERYN